MSAGENQPIARCLKLIDPIAEHARVRFYQDSRIRIFYLVIKTSSDPRFVRIDQCTVRWFIAFFCVVPTRRKALTVNRMPDQCHTGLILFFVRASRPRHREIDPPAGDSRSWVSRWLLFDRDNRLAIIGIRTAL